MDAFRIRKTGPKDSIELLLLQLHEIGYFKTLKEDLTKEVTDMLLAYGSKSEKFLTRSESNLSLIKWLTQIDDEAAAELEKRASNKRNQNDA